jgi:cell division transport system permease protein
MFNFFFKEALANISRNKWLSFAAISTIIFTMAICGLFFVIAVNFGTILKSWKENITVAVYLKENSTEEEINKLKDFFQGVEFIAGTKFISKKEAFKRFSEQSSDIKTLLTGFDSSILPASFEITIKEEFQKSDLLIPWFEEINKFVCVEEISYDRDLIDKLNYIVYALRIVGLIVGVFLCGAAVLIISNTIKLSVYERKDEIEIMELIGATKSFIKTPFIIEGLLQGLIGSIASLTILYASFKYIEAKLFKPLNVFFGSTDIRFIPFQYLLFFIIIGLLLGVFGGVFASGKTFRVEKIPDE